MRNYWLLKKQFPENAVVRVKASGNSVIPQLAGHVGEVTNIFHTTNWIGVYFGHGPKYRPGTGWNVFFPEDLDVLEGHPRLFDETEWN